jgi:hypothetical protein
VSAHPVLSAPVAGAEPETEPEAERANNDRRERYGVENNYPGVINWFVKMSTRWYHRNTLLRHSCRVEYRKLHLWYLVQYTTCGKVCLRFDELLRAELQQQNAIKRTVDIKFNAREQLQSSYN